MKKIRQSFLTGIAVLLPLALTLLIIQYLWNFVDSLIADPLYQTLEFQLDQRLAIALVKGLILLVVIFLVCLLGFATNLLLVRRLIKAGESILSRVPMVNRVYGVIKEISETLFGKGKQTDLFRSAVLIQYPRKGIYSVAFITKSSHPVIDEKSGETVVSVFVPTTPNPTSGVLLFVPKDQITPLPITVEEAVKLVISAGTLTGKSK